VKIKTADLNLALTTLARETGGSSYIEIDVQRGTVTLTAMDAKACEKTVVLFDADANISPRFKTETILMGVKS
jgi:hypothetical protein